MGSITKLVPIRVDASSSNGTIHIIDSLLIDTTCLPVSHSSLSNNSTADLSIHSLVDANAAYLAESIIGDAEVYGAVKSSKNNIGRLDLLSDKQFYQTVEKQIHKQLLIALEADKTTLIFHGDSSNEQITSSSAVPTSNNSVVRIKLRLRHENIALEDEFDYDVAISGIDGFDPFSIATNIVEDLKLPSEFVTSITTSILEQIYGLQVPDSMQDGKGVPSAFILDVAKDGSTKDIAKFILKK
ncbi:hypothetical protein ACHAXM_009181 [Skeletonema potamos]